MKNRNFLAHRLPGLVKIANRNRLSLGIAMLDIDHFKQINDTYGHAVGDECLLAFAYQMHEVFQRESDSIIRYGGEEFLLVCIGMTVTEFARNLERLRQEVETKGLSLASEVKADFSVSAGYVFHPIAPTQWDEKLIAEADEKLYQAKEAGRNRIVGVEKRGPSSNSG